MQIPPSFSTGQMSNTIIPHEEFLQTWSTTLEGYQKVKLSGIDVDGVLRGKLISKDKFLSAIKSDGLGWCSVIFGWDIHDRTYLPELKISNRSNGYKDILARVDLDSFRLIPWESSGSRTPFFLIDFFDPSSSTTTPICACPRGLLKGILKRLADYKDGFKAVAGIEVSSFLLFSLPSILNLLTSILSLSDLVRILSIQGYRFPRSFFGQVRVQKVDQSLATVSTETPQSIKDKNFTNLCPLTVGMHGYSLLRPSLNQEYFDALFNNSLDFGIPIEGHHTETGPGVYETALEYQEALRMADNAALFKLTAKSVGMKYGIIPSFMAKPYSHLPGCSGHIHISLWNKTGENVFQGTQSDPSWPEHTSRISIEAEQFIAGLMTCLSDIIPCLIPTINGYKRLVEGFWAATQVSWGLDSRLASVRIIAPPNCDPKATRLEVRVPGADMNPHYALAAILAAGFYGIQHELSLKDFPPVSGSSTSSSKSPTTNALPSTLQEATQRFMRVDSKARVILGDEFVDHFGRTRENEWKLYTQAVTNWELERYLELA
ncbi:hypothetical protein Pst134EA_028944 [Puccinia striiformis f. sp. tritici]|uniref:hypothetical protein n=1 Tax=Puccinia striiformis f. sp. tritici TaxID=168172 RepID=UPI002008E50F|nr:hypothetical protein Pst134EA_028944 [Puccinia striiformis f. sp. tritici]KAH9446958.1 hypothetical protein Pst134EA_028944 [Puccinia striiformis f. sp. tritici]